MHEGVARAFSSLSTLLSSEEQRMVPMVPVTGRRYGAMHAFRFGRFVLSAAVLPPWLCPQRGRTLRSSFKLQPLTFKGCEAGN